MDHTLEELRIQCLPEVDTVAARHRDLAEEDTERYLGDKPPEAAQGREPEAAGGREPEAAGGKEEHRAELDMEVGLQKQLLGP